MNDLMLIAGREIRTQVRTKGFIIGLIISMALIAGIAFTPKLFGGPDSYTVGLVSAQRLPVPDGGAGEVTIEWRDYPDEDAARRAVLDGDVDAALVGTRVLSDGEIDDQLGMLLQAAHHQAQLTAAGVQTTPLSMEPIGADSRVQEMRSQMAFILMLLLFMMVMSAPIMVAAGVVEEKGSRIVEILLTSVRPWQLLGGKVLGLGVVGLINLIVMLAAGLIGAYASGLAVDFPPGMVGIVTGVIVWFVLGYAFFAALAAAFGSLVSRQEEVGNVLTPITMTMLVSYGVAFYAGKEPTSLVATVVSYIPPFSAMVMPVRATAVATPAWEILLSGALMTAAVAGVVLFAGRIYERAVLRTGARVRLREVLRSR